MFETRWYYQALKYWKSKNTLSKSHQWLPIEDVNL